jgi:hypothetical protein
VPNGEANLELRRPTRSGVSNPADSRREAKRAQIAVAAYDSPYAVEGTHGSQGTPQAQGLSVPS